MFISQNSSTSKGQQWRDSAFLHAPLALLAHRAAAVSGTDQAIVRMRADGFDPAQTAVIEGTPPQEQLASLEASPATDGSSVEITSYSDNRVELVARMENHGLLVLSDTYYPGWKAYVDGKETTVYPTDVALRSVFVPAGEHQVKFVFSPGSFKAGVLISGLSLLVLGTYAITGTVRSLWMRAKGQRSSGQIDEETER